MTESDSNILVIATSDNITTIKQQAITRLTAGYTNDERFVAQFNVESVGNLAGGYLTVAGRLHLDTNGCPAAVLIAMNRDKEDSSLDDKDVTDMDRTPRLRTCTGPGRGISSGC